MKYAAAIMVAAILSCSITFAQDAPEKKPEADQTPVVEVVFVLDTTGSMGGLIQGAKQKIWSIVNHIAEGKPTPTIKVGLVAYRDKGDAYVTKVHDLSEDLDDIFGKLSAFTADGGGDGPESVNQGLYEAVTKITWSSDDKTVRTIFLVGDYPPHMDYQDDVKYPETCKMAVKKDIVINTVQCGGYSGTTPVWQEIAKLSEGVFVQIAQSGGVVAVETPYDKKLAELGRDLDGTVIHFGKAEERRREAEKLDKGAELAEGSGYSGAAADRAESKAKSKPAAPGKDLVSEAEEENFDLNKLKDDELPEEMQKMTKEEREKYIEEKRVEREKLQKEIEELSRKRQEYIAGELKKRGGARDAFDEKVIESVKKQAEKKGIAYEGDTKEEKKEETPREK
jgi:hypothetical protein